MSLMSYRYVTNLYSHQQYVRIFTSTYCGILFYLLCFDMCQYVISIFQYYILRIFSQNDYTHTHIQSVVFCTLIETNVKFISAA